MTRLIDAEKLKKHYAWWEDDERRALFDQIVDAQPTIDAVPLSVVRKAAKKLAYIHQQIDLYGDRPDLHDEEYWLEYLMDEEWKDEEID
jgi:hypothetical protein